jgi:hypothetical protein
VARNLRTSHRKLTVLGDSVPVIPKSYIVVLDDDVIAAAKGSLIDTIRMSGGIVTFQYQDSFNGLATQDVSEDLLNTILDHPDVARVVPVRHF